MENIRLEERLRTIINNLSEGKLDKEVYSYLDLKSKYVNLKPEVIVEVHFTDGKSAKIDVTEYFKGVVK